MKYAENYNEKEINAVLKFLGYKTNEERKDKITGMAYAGEYMEIAFFHEGYDGEYTIIKLTPSYDNSIDNMFNNFKNNKNFKL